MAEVKLLALVSAQDIEDDGAGGVRIAQRVAPERIISTVDLTPAMVIVPARTAMTATSCTSASMSTRTCSWPARPPAPRPAIGMCWKTKMIPWRCQR